MSKFNNFAQFVGYYVVGQPLKLDLTLGWSEAKPKKGKTLVIVTQPTVRRALKIMHTPASIIIEAQDQRLQAILDGNSGTSAAHVAKFERQAEIAKESRAARKLMASIADILAKGTSI